MVKNSGVELKQAKRVYKRRSDRKRRRYDGRCPRAVRIRMPIKEYCLALGDAGNPDAIEGAAEVQTLAEEVRAAAFVWVGYREQARLKTF